MDTAAYLTRQGWRGSGHSLHPSGHGIAKPLLVSKKNDLLGVGNRKNDALASQWWLKAFDTTLKQVNLGVTDGTSKPVEKATSTFQRSFYRNALYSNFVKGEGLSGTHTLVAEPQARMESIRQFDDVGDDGTALESKGKDRDKQRYADRAGGGSLLFPTIASSGNGTLENEMTRGSQRKLIKNRKAGQGIALDSSEEKGTAYLETRPLESGMEENPRFKRKSEVEPRETRYTKFCEDKNSATHEKGALDSDPPRKRQRGRKGLNEEGNVEAPETGGEKGLADAKMELPDREALKDSWSKPKAEDKSGKTEGQERQTVEISDDEMNILSKLEEQLSFGTTTGQLEQVQSANGQDQREQLGTHEQQITKQEMAEIIKLRKKWRKLRRAKRILEQDLERMSQPRTASLSQVADDLSGYHSSASGELNRVGKPSRKNRILGVIAGQPTSSLPPIPRGPRKTNRILGNNAGQPTSSLPPIPRGPRKKNRILGSNAGQPTSSLPPIPRGPRKTNRILGNNAGQPTSSLPPIPRGPRKTNRILGNNAGQPTSSLPPIPRGPRRKKRIPGDNAGQPTLSSPPMAKHVSGENMSASLGKGRARKLRRKNRILRDDAGLPSSYRPSTVNHVSGEDKITALRKKTKRLSFRSSGKHVDDNARVSKSLSRAAELVRGEGKPAPRGRKKTFRRNEELFEFDDEPVATPMDAIAQFLKSRAAT